MEQLELQKRKKVQAVTLSPDLQERVLEIAEIRDWSVAQTGGYLIKLGLEKLDEQQAQTSALPPPAQSGGEAMPA